MSVPAVHASAVSEPIDGNLRLEGRAKFYNLGQGKGAAHASSEFVRRKIWVALERAHGALERSGALGAPRRLIEKGATNVDWPTQTGT
jgi:hypothetical protein